ncbi:hypothetical protein PUV54_05435 [Hyphococcus flavus]|uniref:Uncharacterized protein n=1 Tax=Hyphococcus flavus TaxID=1866326 RepID=A0AAF0CI93_9PROT|nr:hypothetical protein [Hyphococcus flavus]WDI32637.1 hypothetical protein PUV54_05435 [Hyphococcus flavus]
MNASALIAILVSAGIATLGLWWFRFILPVIRKQPKNTRYGVYALIWLAYFILSMLLIGSAAGT